MCVCEVDPPQLRELLALITDASTFIDAIIIGEIREQSHSYLAFKTHNNYSSVGDFLIKYHWPLFSFHYYRVFIGLTMVWNWKWHEFAKKMFTTPPPPPPTSLEMEVNCGRDKPKHTHTHREIGKSHDIRSVTAGTELTVRFEFVPITVF